MTPVPQCWLRVLIRPRFRGAHLPHFVDNLGAEWSRALGAWVLEPKPERRLNPESGQWEDVRDTSAHIRAETALRSLGPEFTLEWQTEGASQLLQRAEDIRPPIQINRGWFTPREDDW